MAPTPYNIALSLRNSQGAITSISLSASDVAAASWLFPSGASEMALSSNDCWITDVLCTTTATDCKTCTLYINGINSGRVIYPNANQGGFFARQIMQTPVFVTRGALIKVIQSA